MKPEEYGVFETKTHLSELVQRVEEEGATFCITKRGKPVAELRPIGGAQQRARLPFGYRKGSVTHMADDFDAPLDDFREYME